ncbi:MAG: S41 family peptidase [bacterium]|nr:S41 family peptidase [bacterium]
MKISKEFRVVFYGLAAVIVLAGVFSAGAFWSYSNRPAVEKIANLTNKNAGKPAEVDFSPFWKAWNAVDEKFVANGDLDTQKRVWGAIEGMMASLDDPYSVFFPPQESKTFQDDIRGDFSGVGMEIGSRKGVLTVIAPLKGTPAYNTGIKPGDKIIKIDDKMSADMAADEAAMLIRGKRGTAVKLTIIREGEDKPLEIKITRDTIQIPVLDTEVKPNGIFVIKLYNFSAKSVNAFRGALREFASSGSDKMILDLRGNPGGYLEAAVDMASWFLPAGKVVAREKFSDGSETLSRSKGYDVFKKMPMVILVDGGSASASEILAGALNEHGVATLVGEKTYGKGSVQELIQITPETSLKLTIARWLTPNGKSISKEGLEPDVKVEFTKEDFEAGKDPQMEKAIEILNGK